LKTRQAGIPALVALVAVVAHPTSSWAGRPDPPPSAVGVDPTAWAIDDGWHLTLGSAQRDTVTATPEAALLAAREALADDEWEFGPSNDLAGMATTTWKTIHNVIFRLFSGKSFCRCYVAVRELATDRVEITFQGGLATRRDIERSAIRGFAERSYASAARTWQREVRKLVASRVDGQRTVEGGVR
jgi:hypothetical protein